MNIYAHLLGKYFNPDEILHEAMCIAGSRPNGEVLLALTIRRLCEKIEVLEKEIKDLKEKA